MNPRATPKFGLLGTDCRRHAIVHPPHHLPSQTELAGFYPHRSMLPMTLIASESGHGLHIYAARAPGHFGTWASLLKVGGASYLS